MPQAYGMKTCGLPGILAPRYQECFAIGSNVRLATSLTSPTHFSTASGLASMRSSPFERMCSMQSEIQSACCSMATGMLHRTEGCQVR